MTYKVRLIEWELNQLIDNSATSCSFIKPPLPFRALKKPTAGF